LSDDYSVIIENGIIVDGTGSQPYKGAVAVRGERIAAVGKDVSGAAETIIDAGGHIVSPGFIDVHNHGDSSLLYYPEAQGFTRQGITTFVGGQCGASAAPVGENVYLAGFYWDFNQRLDPSMYYPYYVHPIEKVNELHREQWGWEIDWTTMGGFFKKVEETGISLNYVPQVGHGAVRYMVMGRDFKREATADEVKEMQDYVREAMEDKCQGMSVGRDYDPGIWASREELIECTKVVAEYGGIYASHSLRSGHRTARRPGEFPPIGMNGILEAIDVGRQSGAAVQVSHMGSGFRISPGGNRMVTEAAIMATLKVIDDAQAEGLDVHFDTIPNHLGGGVYASNHLVGSLLPWLRVAGSRDELAKALRMKDFREEIKETVWAGKWYGLNPNISEGWARGRLILKSSVPDYEGKTVSQIAVETGKDELDALMDILMNDPYAMTGRPRSYNDWTKMIFYKHPSIMVGVDTYITDHTWACEEPPFYKPNENNFGGFCMYFKRTVRETGTLSIEEAVWKVSGLPAKKYKLRDRGALKLGAYADIVIMDLENVNPKATALEPCIYPEGIEHVFVNGGHIVDNSEHTGARPGKVLRRE